MQTDKRAKGAVGAPKSCCRLHRGAHTMTTTTTDRSFQQRQPVSDVSLSWWARWPDHYSTRRSERKTAHQTNPSSIYSSYYYSPSSSSSSFPSPSISFPFYFPSQRSSFFLFPFRLRSTIVDTVDVWRKSSRTWCVQKKKRKKKNQFPLTPQTIPDGKKRKCEAHAESRS